jgi:hypothetical protein
MSTGKDAGRSDFANPVVFIIDDNIPVIELPFFRDSIRAISDAVFSGEEEGEREGGSLEVLLLELLL